MTRRRSVPETPDCPAWLDDDARRRWWELAPSVAALHGQLTPLLAHALGRYLEAYQQWKAAGLVLRARGSFYRTTRNGWRFWPEYVERNRASRTMMYLGRQLGLTPLARAKILARRRKRR